MNRFVSFVARRFFPIWYARKIGVAVGNNCRLINVSYSTEPYLISIGDHVSATFCHIETHDGGVWVFRDVFPKLDVLKRVVIGNNVFIGYGSVILPGTVIGNNVVVGARSVVSGRIPDDVVVAGVPAKVIRTLDAYKSKVLEEGFETALLSSEDKARFLMGKCFNK